MIRVWSEKGEVTTEMRGSPQDVTLETVIAVIGLLDRLDTDAEKDTFLTNVIRCLTALECEVKEKGWGYVHGQTGS